MSVKYASAEEIGQIIKATGRKISYVIFQKRDGTMREMWFRSYIPKKFLAGGERAYDPDAHQLTWVRDIAINDGPPIRSIRWCSVIYLASRNTKWRIRNGRKV